MKLAAIAVACLAAAVPAFAQDPTAGEQAMIYELNRARNNPQRYAQENGLGTLLDGIAPAPPLAVSAALLSSSGFHTNEMATYNYFAHQSAVTGEWPNKMERDAGYALASWLSDTANNVESIAAGTTLNTLSALRLLIEDAGTSPPGHRYHLLATGPNASFWLLHREIGAGEASNASSAYTNYFAVHTGFTDTSVPLITGVVYVDLNANGRYDLGEGLAGVTVSVAGGGSTTSNAAGGWSIATGSGTFTVSASGGAFAGTSTGVGTVGSDNVEIDFASGVAAAEVGFANQPGSSPPPPPGTSSGGGKKRHCALGGSGGGDGAFLLVVAALAAMAAARRRI